jgi:hypothetical protein
MSIATVRSACVGRWPPWCCRWSPVRPTGTETKPCLVRQPPWSGTGEIDPQLQQHGRPGPHGRPSPSHLSSILRSRCSCSATRHCRPRETASVQAPAVRAGLLAFSSTHSGNSSPALLPPNDRPGWGRTSVSDNTELLRGANLSDGTATVDLNGDVLARINGPSALGTSVGTLPPRTFGRLTDRAE